MMPPKAPALLKFHKLVDGIAQLYTDARKVQLKFGWETGRRIVQVEQDGHVRAAYGANLIPQLSKALTEKFGPGFSESNLRKIRHFYLCHPKQSPATELDWTDYIELLPIKDDLLRRRLETRILKENLKSKEIRRIVQAIRREPEAKEKTLPALKRPADLKLNTFRVSKLRAKLEDGYVLVDCGFFVSWPVVKTKLKDLDVASEMSYAYAAEIDRVIDGDTLLCLIEVGFGIIVLDRLRLRGVNTPELGTPEGDAAKKFVENLLPSGSAVVIKSHKWKTDPHGRFVADVFYKPGVEDPELIVKDGNYLNQELLDTGHAVRMAE